MQAWFQALVLTTVVTLAASQERRLKSLVGDYRREHVISDITGVSGLRILEANPLPKPKMQRRARYANEPDFDLRGHLYRIFGIDLTAIPGISVLTAHTLLAEVGPDISRFRSAAAFASWLGLCPDNDISGGKKLSVKIRHVKNRAAWALRMAVNGLQKKPNLAGQLLPPHASQVGSPQGDYSHCSQISTNRLSATFHSPVL